VRDTVGQGKHHQGGRRNRGENKELENSITKTVRKQEEKTRKQHHRKGEETGGGNQETRKQHQRKGEGNRRIN
jgi:hypothetical protein